MRIATCLAEVPARETRYRIADSQRWIREEDLSYEINECDEYALEEALTLKDHHGGEVVIFTVGRVRAEKLIRKGLAMGADRAVLIVDEDDVLSDPFGKAAALAEVLRNQGFDLVLAGTQSDHYGYAQTGVLLGELLGLPHATIVMQVEARPEERRIRALREMESGTFQWFELPLPSLLTIQAGSSPVRFPSLKGIMQAKKKEIRRVPVTELGVSRERLPGINVRRLYFPETSGKVEILRGDTGTVVSQLIEKLRKEARVL